jgi:hypothetical protein
MPSHRGCIRIVMLIASGQSDAGLNPYPIVSLPLVLRFDPAWRPYRSGNLCTPTCADVWSRQAVGQSPGESFLPPGGSKGGLKLLPESCLPLRDAHLQPVCSDPGSASPEPCGSDQAFPKLIPDCIRACRQPRASRCICGSPSLAQRPCAACFPTLLRASQLSRSG